MQLKRFALDMAFHLGPLRFSSRRAILGLLRQLLECQSQTVLLRHYPGPERKYPNLACANSRSSPIPKKTQKRSGTISQVDKALGNESGEIFCVGKMLGEAKRCQLCEPKRSFVKTAAKDGFEPKATDAALTMNGGKKVGVLAP